MFNNPHVQLVCLFKLPFVLTNNHNGDHHEQIYESLDFPYLLLDGHNANKNIYYHHVLILYVSSNILFL